MLEFADWPARAMGPVAVCLLGLASILSTRSAPVPVTTLLRTTTLWLGVMLAIEAAWVFWARSGLPCAPSPCRPLVGTGDHDGSRERVASRLFISTRLGESARRTGPVLLATTLFVLIALLGHEGAFFDRVTKHTPLTLWETLASPLHFLA